MPLLHKVLATSPKWPKGQDARPFQSSYVEIKIKSFNRGCLRGTAVTFGEEPSWITVLNQSRCLSTTHVSTGGLRIIRKGRRRHVIRIRTSSSSTSLTWQCPVAFWNNDQGGSRTRLLMNSFQFFISFETEKTDLQTRAPTHVTRRFWYTHHHHSSNPKTT